MHKYAGKMIGVGIIVLCLGTMAFVLPKSFQPYVQFNEAMNATNSTVQIIGAPVNGTLFYDDDAHLLHFTLKDDSGATMPVLYKGPKPEDLDTAMAKATKITAQGSYDPSANAFVAENLLVKCPSKYQGTTDRSYKSST